MVRGSAGRWVARLRSQRRESLARRGLAAACREGAARQSAARVADARLPLISVVTPSYNQARFLEQCIESVLGQGYPRLEYLIVDGGSTDGSVEIIRRYADRLSSWVSEPDHGQGDAINKGFARARGELVAWLNADDFYLPGALLAAAEAYRNDPQASFYFGDGFRVGEDGTARAAFFPHGPQPYDEAAMIFGMNYVLQPATFMRREPLAAIGHLDAELHYGLDTDLWIRLARVEELRRIAERHAGVAMTPGVLCYFFDTLDRLAGERPDLFPARFRGRIHDFWAATSRLLLKHGVGPDGFPRPDRAPTSERRAAPPRPR